MSHSVQEWFSCHKQASLGLVATKYNELESMAKFICLVMDVSLSEILADVCMDQLDLKDSANDNLSKLLNLSDFGGKVKMRRAHRWQGKVMIYLENHGKEILQSKKQVVCLVGEDQVGGTKRKIS